MGFPCDEHFLVMRFSNDGISKWCNCQVTRFPSVRICMWRNTNLKKKKNSMWGNFHLMTFLYNEFLFLWDLPCDWTSLWLHFHVTKMSCDEVIYLTILQCEKNSILSKLLMWRNFYMTTLSWSETSKWRDFQTMRFPSDGIFNAGICMWRKTNLTKFLCGEISILWHSYITNFYLTRLPCEF